MTVALHRRNLRWDIFCRVVDNYGDAAVCWRLARDLAARGAVGVRLWIDRPDVLSPLHASIDEHRVRQSVDGVDIRHWFLPFDTRDLGDPADVVVEGFGCGLPDAYVEAMAALQDDPAAGTRHRAASQWIVLEYLSAEPWVATHHGLPSPHPRLPIDRNFFFPGFTQDTGGLIKEAGLDARREAFQASRAARDAWWRRLGFDPVSEQALTVSLFGYENAAAASLLDAWARGSQPVVAAVPPGRLRPQVLQFFGAADARDGEVLRRGSLEARLVPFLTQDGYDELLWACDWNFVRGEDSFVRAQWAARPLVWQIYPQAADAHRVKLEAFLDRWCEGLAPEAASAFRRLWLTWNGMGEGSPVPDCGAAWREAIERETAIAAQARKWAKALDLSGNLAEKLAQFCRDRLESPAS